MIANQNYEQCAPLTWVGKVPVYLATVIAAAYGVAMIFCAVARAANAQWFFDTFTFSTFGALEQFHLWQFVSYAFVVFEPREYLWIALQLFFLASFGREVEKFIGRASFAWFYGALLLAPPIFLSLLSLAGGQHIYAGSGAVNFAVFIAFAYIYPRAEIFMSIEARWVALVLLGINSLMLLGGQNATGLGILWLECIVAVGWMIKEGVGTFELPSPAAFFKRKHSQRKLRVVPKNEPAKEVGLHDSIDPILEKIASRGMSSLTRAERETLERARVALLEKERQG